MDLADSVGTAVEIMYRLIDQYSCDVSSVRLMKFPLTVQAKQIACILPDGKVLPTGKNAIGHRKPPPVVGDRTGNSQQC
jgi:hypothetical protein